MIDAYLRESSPSISSTWKFSIEHLSAKRQSLKPHVYFFIPFFIPISRRQFNQSTQSYGKWRLFRKVGWSAITWTGNLKRRTIHTIPCLYTVTGYASTVYTLIAYNHMITLSPGFFIWAHITGIDAVKVPRASFFLTKPRNTKLRILGETLVWSSQYKKESKAQG